MAKFAPFDAADYLDNEETIAEQFGWLIKPLFARASAATKESRALAALRDTLLPMLISGELRTRSSGVLTQEMTL